VISEGGVWFLSGLCDACKKTYRWEA